MKKSLLATTALALVLSMAGCTANCVRVDPARPVSERAGMWADSDPDEFYSKVGTLAHISQAQGNLDIRNAMALCRERLLPNQDQWCTDKDAPKYTERSGTELGGVKYGDFFLSDLDIQGPIRRYIPEGEEDQSSYERARFINRKLEEVYKLLHQKPSVVLRDRKIDNDFLSITVIPMQIIRRSPRPLMTDEPGFLVRAWERTAAWAQGWMCLDASPAAVQDTGPARPPEPGKVGTPPLVPSHQPAVTG